MRRIPNIKLAMWRRRPAGGFAIRAEKNRGRDARATKTCIFSSRRRNAV